MNTSPPRTRPSPRPAPPPSAPRPGLFRQILRVARWMALASIATVLFLVLKTGAPPPVHRDPGAAERLDGKLRRFALDRGTGSAHPLRLDEAELNGWIATTLELGDSSPSQGASASPQMAAFDAPAGMSANEASSKIRDVTMHMAGDRLTAYVVFDLYGKDVSLTLEGRLSVRDGYLRLDPTAMSLGSLPIPQSTVNRAVASLFDSPESREHFRMPEEIRDLTVENGELVVTTR
jgi:hypothetical protein